MNKLHTKICEESLSLLFKSTSDPIGKRSPQKPLVLDDYRK